MPEPKKKSWADITEEEELKSLEVPVILSKHGIKVIKRDKTIPSIESKKNAN
jgi:hypothetical protein